MKKLLFWLFFRKMKPFGVAWLVLSAVQLLRKLGGTTDQQVARREIHPGERVVVRHEPRRRK